MQDKRGLLLIVAAATLWGTTGTAQALGSPDAGPIAVGAMRLVIAGPALLLIAGFTGNLPRKASKAWRAIAVAAVAMASYQPAFFSAVRETGVAMGTVVAIGSAPFLAGMLGWLVDGERPTRRWWVATATGALGVSLIGLAGAEAGADATGIFLALLAGLSFAVYVVASRRVVTLTHPVGGTAIVFIAAAAISIPLLWVVDLDWMGTIRGLVAALHLGVVATALAYVIFAAGLRTTPTAPAATASLSEPVTAVALGSALLGETPGLTGWIGIGCVLLALVILFSGRLPLPPGDL